MPYIVERIPIPKTESTWGIELSQIATLPDVIAVDDSTTGWPTVSFHCTEILGISSTHGRANAPALDRPVLQIIYDISSQAEGEIDESAAYWLAALNDKLGQPFKMTDNRSANITTPSGGVVLTSRWKLDDILVTLAVHDRQRSTAFGEIGAGLFIDWKNEMKAAKPYRQEQKALQFSLTQAMHDLKSFVVYKLDMAQVPFYMADYGESDPHKALKDDVLRASQKCLYQRDLMETPDIIRQRLNEKEVAIWRSETDSAWGVSTEIDTVIFERTSRAPIKFLNILPARGSGGMYVHVGGLSLKEKANSSHLVRFVEGLQEIVKDEIVCETQYDY